MSEIWDRPADVPYAEISNRLFAREGRQEMVPFLGAGVSVSAREPTEPLPATPGLPDAATMEKIWALLGLPSDAVEAQRFIAYAIRSALWMYALRPPQSAARLDSVASRLKAAPYPPFASELSQLLSERASYTYFQDRPIECLRSRSLLPEHPNDGCVESLITMFKLLAEVTGLAQACDPLASIAEFLQHKLDREALRDALASAFTNKARPTPTHTLIAKAAKFQLSRTYPEDYLAITTNYDCLLEKAFEQESVPYVVITIERENRKAQARFGNLPEDEQRILQQRNPSVPARTFQLNKGRTLAIIFKIHGCLEFKGAAEDSIVITETDYVRFISNIDETLPAAVGGLLPGKRFLFLGYSFSDWNVRSIYESVCRRSNERIRDYAVTRALSSFERQYFKERNIGVVLQDLSDFTSRVASQALTDA